MNYNFKKIKSLGSVDLVNTWSNKINVFSQKKVRIYSRQEQGTLLIFLTIFESLTLFHVLFWEVQEHYVYMMLPFLLATGAILTSEIFSTKNSVLLLDKDRSFNA